MRIRMVCGTYGYRNGDGTMETKDARSGPFEVDEGEGKRLVRMGYAVQTGSVPERGQQEEAESHGGTGDTVDRDMESLADLSKKELECMARDMGLSTNGTKEQLVERITGACGE